MRVAAALIAFPLAAQAQDPRVEVVNQSDAPISELLVQAEGATTWSRLTLANPIAPGERRSVRMPSDATSCLLDIRAIYEDRRAQDPVRVNACSEESVVFAAARPDAGESR